MISLKENLKGESPLRITRDYYPTIHLTSDKLGEDYEVGDKIKLTINTRVSSESRSLGSKTGYTLELLEFEKEDMKKEEK